MQAFDMQINNWVNYEYIRFNRILYFSNDCNHIHVEKIRISIKKLIFITIIILNLKFQDLLIQLFFLILISTIYYSINIIVNFLFIYFLS